MRLKSTPKSFAGLVLAATLIAPLLPAASSNAATLLPWRPTLSQLTSLLSSSLAKATLPDLTATVPPASRIHSPVFNKIPLACFNPDMRVAVPANVATKCLFGDRHVKRRIVLFGDDTAAMWFPAMALVAGELHWKLFFIGKPGCSPWGLSSNAGTSPCRKFIREEVAFINAQHVRYVIPMGAKVGWHHTKNATLKQLSAEMTSTIMALRPSRSHLILFQVIPQFNPGFTERAPLSCFARRGDLRTCEAVIHNVALNSTLAVALPTVAVAQKIPLIATTPFFCHSARCALYLQTPAGNILVYSDRFHMGGWFSLYISRALEETMKPVLR
jgi:hypothetical protein